MAITDWPEDERPRERLCRHGAGALSDAELLAIFLRVGVRGKSAVDLARALLEKLDGKLSQLASNSPQALVALELPGLGTAKASQLVAAMELSRRALAQTLRDQSALDSPVAVRQWLQLKLAGANQEIFCALWLNNQNILIRHDELSRGTLTQAAVYPREVARRALELNAAAVIFAHNHPGGSTQPSAADRRLTEQLKTALALFDIRVLDHFIICDGQAPYSFAEQGAL